MEGTISGINNLVKGTTIQVLNIWNNTIKTDQVQQIQNSKQGLKVTVGDNLEKEIIKIINPKDLMPLR